MPRGILDALGGPWESIIGAVGKVVDGLHTSGEEKLQAQRELLQLQLEFQKFMVNADVELAKQQASIITEETKAGGLAGSWRPMLMLTFTFIIAWNFIIAPMFSLVSLPIPESMWELLKLGIGGYIIGRTVEKTAEALAPAVAAKKAG